MNQIKWKVLNCSIIWYMKKYYGLKLWVLTWFDLNLENCQFGCHKSFFLDSCFWNHWISSKSSLKLPQLAFTCRIINSCVICGFSIRFLNRSSKYYWNNRKQSVLSYADFVPKFWIEYFSQNHDVPSVFLWWIPSKTFFLQINLTLIQTYF